MLAEIFTVPDLPWMKIFALFWAIHIIALSVWVLLQKRSPISTIGWIITLAFIPYIGFLIYHFLGPYRLRRQYLRWRLVKTSLKEHNHLLQLRSNAQKAGKEPSIKTEQLSKLISKTAGFPVTTATYLEFLSDGKNTYQAIFEAISKAKHHIHLEYYTYEPDHIGTALRDLLIEKAKEGIEVRLLVDGLGSSRLKRHFIQPLLDAGGKFAIFHPLHFYQLLRPLLNLRTHRKIVICDGTVGFTGGINITDEENEEITPNAFHDIHLKLVGNAVHSLQLLFIEDWLYATHKTDQFNIRTYLPEHEAGPFPVQVFSSGPDNEWETIHRFYLGAIHSARERIWITTPYFVPTEATLYALTSAALRGIDVRLLIPHQSDSFLVTCATRSYFDELLKAGASIWEYQEQMLHSKTLIIDQIIALIGTANFDARSFKLNFEVCTAIYDMSFCQQLAAIFIQDLKKAKRVQEQRKISFFEKFIEALARLFSPLL